MFRTSREGLAGPDGPPPGDYSYPPPTTGSVLGVVHIRCFCGVWMFNDLACSEMFPRLHESPHSAAAPVRTASAALTVSSLCNERSCPAALTASQGNHNDSTVLRRWGFTVVMVTMEPRQSPKPKETYSPFLWLVSVGHRVFSVFSGFVFPTVAPHPVLH